MSEERINRKMLLFEISQTLQKKKRRKIKVVDNNPDTGRETISESEVFAMGEDIEVEIIYNKEQIQKSE